jgi:hypothetical protein
MSRGGGGGTQTTTQRQELPAWVNEAGQANYRLAEQIAARPYQAFGGERVAGFAPQQQELFSRVGQMQGQGASMVAPGQALAGQAGAFNPMMVSAAGQAPNVVAGRFTDADLGAYLNPYLSQVENSALGALNRQRELALRDAGDEAIRAGAFGGSRHGVREAVIDSETARAAADASAQIRNQGFTTAANLITTDLNRGLSADQANQQAAMEAARQSLTAQGANQSAGLTANDQRLRAAATLGNLAQQASGVTAQELALLEASGAQQQALQQAILDDQYQRFVEQRDWDVQGLNLRASTLANSPYERTQITTAPVTRPDRFGQILGAGAQFAGMAAMFSDEREKTDREPIGRDPETGLPLEAYRYKSDPKSYPKVVGIMAQDVERIAPERVKTTTSGKKIVNMRGLMGAMG